MRHAIDPRLGCVFQTLLRAAENRRLLTEELLRGNLVYRHRYRLRDPATFLEQIKIEANKRSSRG